MNARIQELVNQSYSTVEFEFAPFQRVFNKQKFAELVVAECIALIENEAQQYHEPVWAIELVGDIKQHFGVRE